MNQLTTIAALPMGGGVAAALPAEVGKESDWARYCREITESNWRMFNLYGCTPPDLLRLGYHVNAQGVIERVKP